MVMVVIVVLVMVVVVVLVVVPPPFKLHQAKHNPIHNLIVNLYFNLRFNLYPNLRFDIRLWYPTSIPIATPPSSLVSCCLRPQRSFDATSSLFPTNTRLKYSLRPLAIVSSNALMYYCIT